MIRAWGYLVNIELVHTLDAAPQACSGQDVLQNTQSAQGLRFVWLTFLPETNCSLAHLRMSGLRQISHGRPFRKHRCYCFTWAGSCEQEPLPFVTPNCLELCQLFGGFHP